MNAPAFASADPVPARFTVDEFLRMDQAGVFEGHGRTELIDGEIYFMNAQYRPHARIKAQFYDALRDGLRAIGSPLTALMEVTVSIPSGGAPQPDIVVTSEADGEGPVPAVSVVLLVEISDSTLGFDLGTKSRTYARAGLAEYWVVDIEHRCVHCHNSPGAEGYPEPVVVPFGVAVKAASLDGLVVRTDELN
jgi:Uma2 family endonuclease